MKQSIIVLMFLSSRVVFSQSVIDTTIKLDLLRAPASPASNLLGIAPSDIDKPTDVSAFMLSLQSATGTFSKLPTSYAVDFSPYWLFNKKPDNSVESFMKAKGKEVLQQTFVVSFAFRNTDSVESTLTKNSIYGGLGFRISFKRGELEKKVETTYKKIKAFQRVRTDSLQKWQQRIEGLAEIAKMRDSLKIIVEELKKIDPAIDPTETAKFKDLQKRLAKKTAEHAAQQPFPTDEMNSIKELSSKFQIERVGWNWDLAGGISTEFRNRKFDNSKVYNAGLWTTVGYTGKKGSTFLFLLRYLYNPDKVFAKDNTANKTGNISTLDGGFKYCYSKSQSKLNISLEAIYRSVLSSNTIDPSYRLVFNADYAIWQNQKLTFSFGRNFDGTISKDGNLVAALGFLTGFGNNR